MKAIILAAGRGSRLEELTDEHPKCLLEVRGKTLLDWQLEALKGAGISQIAIVTGYKRELLCRPGLKEFHNERWAKTNMVASLASANTWLMEGPTIVSYSDIFYASSAVSLLTENRAALAITYDPNWQLLWTRRFGNPLIDAETFRLNSDSTISKIGDKPRSVEEIQGQYMGLLRFTPEGWTEVSRIINSLTFAEYDRINMTSILQKVIDAGNLPINAFPHQGEWGEVDSAEDLEAYRV